MSEKKQSDQKDIDFRISILEDPKSKKTDRKQALKILKRRGVIK